MPDGSIDFRPAISGKPAKSPQPRKMSVTHAETIEDIMRVTAIRAAVYMTEQDYGYEEEFDGNDFCATHLIGWVGQEPAACLRIRYFGGFAKIERVAVRPPFRNTRIVFTLVRAAFQHCTRKGFSKVVGHAREDLIPLYKMFGCKVAERSKDTGVYADSNFLYMEMIWEGELPEDAITLSSDPYALIRTEGRWDAPGAMEQGLLDRSDQMAVAAE
ncbi:GNAT family N-acetyltransferase [Algicella marina]|uniref:GNAT family N-acetyltransferase n=1 Tax=Algicella marina TaxID=2683284 RepID=A0A6P1SVX0_9RHOB|nr:GNAT family N-acetyltransferase [Algicella marina]QHQ33685.1 GNAT family N-acetyltransferase [Algicella marina]